MISPIEIGTVLYSALSLVLLWVLAVCWRDYRLDAFRQRLFDLRSDLFDYAANDNIRFDSPLYGELRNNINSMIRFGHFVTFGTLVSVLLTRKVFPESTKAP